MGFTREAGLKRRSMNERGCLSLLLSVPVFIIQRKRFFVAYADRLSDASEVSLCDRLFCITNADLHLKFVFLFECNL